MSNKTTLQTNNITISHNNLTIDDILNTINNLPEASGGSGGGATLETCEVTLSISGDMGVGDYISNVMYTTFENGVITNKNIDVSSDLPTTSGGNTGGNWVKSSTLQVVVGTNVYLYDGFFTQRNVLVSDNITLTTLDEYNTLFSATINSGSSATITATT